jgi:hypothetical protein
VTGVVGTIVRYLINWNDDPVAASIINTLVQILTFRQPQHLPIMTKTRNTATSRKRVEDDSSMEISYDTSAIPTNDTNVRLPFFRDTRTKIKNAIAHPKPFCWVMEYGDRNILCWDNADKKLRKDIQLITIEKSKALIWRCQTSTALTRLIY